MATTSRLWGSLGTSAFFSLAIGTASAQASFVVPTTATYGWDRPSDVAVATSTLTTYQQWDVFTTPAGPNAPDVGNINPNGTGNVYDTSGMSFITSGGNIYSPTGILQTKADIPSFGLGASHGTHVLFQVRTQGTELAYEDVRLVYQDDQAPQTHYPITRQELNRQALGGFGGTLVDTLFLFQIPYSPAMFRIEFPAAGTSMSADRIAVDTWTVIPEPGLVGVVGGMLLLHRRRRGRQAR